MLFKDIKPNYNVFIFDKQEVKLSEGRVTNISFPYIRDTRNQNPTGLSNPYHINQMNNERVLDITIDIEGRSATYSIPENLSVAIANNLVISTDLEGITKEVQAMNNTSDQFLKTVDQQKEVHQNIFDRTNAILADIDPASKEKQAIDKRFISIESSMSGLRDEVKGISRSIREFLDEFKTPTKRS